MMEKKYYLEKDKKEDREAVTNALKQFLSEKELENFFSDITKLFVEVLYKYIDIVNEKYKLEEPFGFYQMVALSRFKSKELLFLIFQKYEELDKMIIPFVKFIENKNIESFKYFINITENVLPELIKIKKYNLSFAENDIDNLIIYEIKNLFTEKDKNTEQLKKLIDEILKSKIKEGIKEKYKEIKNLLIK